MNGLVLETCNSAECRLELPKIDSGNVLVNHYADCDGNWVAFRWDAYTAQTVASRTDAWDWDPEIPADKGVVSEADHKKDGYDKGHLVASADRLFCEDANKQTFYYSNMSPQIGNFNQGFWESLEGLVQKWGRSTKQGVFDTVYVVKGGSINNLLINFTGEILDQNGVAPETDEYGRTIKGLVVPAYYYMAVLTYKSGEYKSIGFYVPHREDLPKNPSNAELKKYAVSIDELEEKIGLDLFHNLPDDIEDRVEANSGLSL